MDQPSDHSLPPRDFGETSAVSAEADPTFIVTLPSTLPTSTERSVEQREGDLTTAWRILLGLAWSAAFFSYAAVWQASVQIGISTWWLGPRSDPALMVLRLIPFLGCLLMVLLIVYRVRPLPHIGIVLSGALMAVSVPDFSRSIGLAVTELVIAVALTATSVASLTGRYRLAELATVSSGQSELAKAVGARVPTK